MVHNMPTENNSTPYSYSKFSLGSERPFLHRVISMMTTKCQQNVNLITPYNHCPWKNVQYSVWNLRDPRYKIWINSMNFHRSRFSDWFHTLTAQSFILNYCIFSEVKLSPNRCQNRCQSQFGHVHVYFVIINLQ